MIKGHGVMFLDGDYHREYPNHEVIAINDGARWTVVRRGPTYLNQYAVTEFDADGLVWLEAHRPKAGAPTVPEVSQTQKAPEGACATTDSTSL